MNGFLIGCYTVALLAELGGLELIVAQGRKTRRVLLDFDAKNPNGQEGGTIDQLSMVNDVVTGLLRARVRIGLAVVLLVLGIIAGAVGNFASIGH